MDANDLIARRNRILSSVIRHYVSTGEPVSSSTICRREKTGLSPATVRNVLADLERLELVWQPHTSAGRIPTEKGYRYYVNSLMVAWKLTENEKRVVDRTYGDRGEHLETVIERTSKLLSSITSHVGAIVFPSLKASVFRHVKLVPVPGKRILVVIVTGAGVILDSLIDFEEDINEAEMERTARFINSEFSGMTASRMKEKLEPALLDENDPFLYLRARAKKIIKKSGLMEREEHVSLNGVGHMARNPEFRDVERLKEVLEFLDEKDKVRILLRRDDDKKGVAVRIGRENEFEKMKGCSVVVAGYRTGKSDLGSLGVIGPTRMAYDQVTAFVDYVAEALGRFIRENE